MITIAADPKSKTPRLTIDVWADVVCPWCYIGGHRLQKAVEQSPYADAIDLRIHTFQLDPALTDDVVSTAAYLAAKYNVSLDQAVDMDRHAAAQAKADGLPYTLDRPLSNTFDMLRLVHLGNQHGVGWSYMKAMQAELFGGNPDAFRHDTLIRLGIALGIPADEIRDVLATDRFAEDVWNDQNMAVKLGARGVPFTVLCSRVAIPGATTAEQYARAIAYVWEKLYGADKGRGGC